MPEPSAAKSISINGVKWSYSLVDTNGSIEDDDNIVKIVQHMKSDGVLHAFFLVINFDHAMQEVVKLLVDTFGSSILKQMGMVFTRSYTRSGEETANYVNDDLKRLIERRTDLSLPFSIPSW